MTGTTRKNAGFTLVEMLVVAPIVILFIGSVIYLLVNLTGETIASRNEDALTYDVQRALAQIESDVQTSEQFLAVSDISLTTTGQGYGDTPSTDSTTVFKNIETSGGSSASLIIQSYATNGNPNSDGTGLVFLANEPNDCSDPALYSQNTPLSMNIVYFTDTNGTLWRRTLMPDGYNSPSYICGNAPWQLPSCVEGYESSRTFCKTTDEKIAEGVTFDVSYFVLASDSTPNTTANDPGASDGDRNTALLTTPTVRVELTTSKTIAGRDISRTGTTYATRF